MGGLRKRGLLPRHLYGKCRLCLDFLLLLWIQVSRIYGYVTGMIEYAAARSVWKLAQIIGHFRILTIEYTDSICLALESYTIYIRPLNPTLSEPTQGLRLPLLTKRPN